MRTIVITPPDPFVDLDTAKAHLRVEDTSSDALITAYIAAACATIDGPQGWLNRAIGPQTLEWRGEVADYCAGWGPKISLPCPPVTAVTSFKYLDTTGAEQTLATDQYAVRGGSIEPAYQVTWPARRDEPESVRIRYTAGYVTIPPPIVSAVLLMVGDLYQFRETAFGGERAAAAAVPMSTTVEALLAPFRVFV